MCFLLRQTFDGAAFGRMICSAAASIELKKQKINELKKLDAALFERWSVNPAPFIPSFGALKQSFQIENRLYRSPDKALVQEVYSLCKTNMEGMYNACSWKWNEKKECALRSPV